MMALVREVRVRLGFEVGGAGGRCRSGVEADRREELRAGSAGRLGRLSAFLAGDTERDCRDEAETNVSLDELELCDTRRKLGVCSWYLLNSSVSSFSGSTGVIWTVGSFILAIPVVLSGGVGRSGRGAFAGFFTTCEEMLLEVSRAVTGDGGI
jgi:hypothetical protein